MRAGVKWGGDEPQGGRISLIVINNEGDEIQLNMRLETIPSLHGEDVVIRLFNLSVQYLNLENLKLTKTANEHPPARRIAPPRLVLAVGPTGSGKTSTLYSIMNHLNNPTRPRLSRSKTPSSTSSPASRKSPFAQTTKQLFMEELRAVLREDPNIIMIGEIRDADTAKTALQAALTGHLVLSTFHATNAAAAITRLMDMIGQNPLLASLSSSLWPNASCVSFATSAKAYEPSKEELTVIKSALAGMPESTRPSPRNIQLAKPVGCPVCHHFGYRRPHQHHGAARDYAQDGRAHRPTAQAATMLPPSSPSRSRHQRRHGHHAPRRHFLTTNLCSPDMNAWASVASAAYAPASTTARVRSTGN
jgi:type II secretory ATPase GspE/PulE/Tfp pilus assembly ATPase PilB-like protein